MEATITWIIWIFIVHADFFIKIHIVHTLLLLFALLLHLLILFFSHLLFLSNSWWLRLGVYGYVIVILLGLFNSLDLTLYGLFRYWYWILSRSSSFSPSWSLYGALNLLVTAYNCWWRGLVLRKRWRGLLFDVFLFFGYLLDWFLSLLNTWQFPFTHIIIFIWFIYGELMLIKE